MKKLIFTLIAASGILFANAQAPNWCGINEHTQKMRNEFGYNEIQRAEEAAYEEEIQEFIRNYEPEQRGGQTIYVIPIVFHIAHVGGPENISVAQVYNQIDILNRDYNKMNADTAQVHSAFANNIANVGFEFRLAQKDAFGNCVSGITRTFTTSAEVGDNAMVTAIHKNNNAEIGQPTNGNNIRFPRNKYLNIWVCKSIDNGGGTGAVLGYTTNPMNWGSNYDGIWIVHSAIGDMGTSSAQRSRTLTHEIGHWMNLDHVWGNTNNPGVACGDDNVADTPITMGWSSCNVNGATCGNVVDNVQNFMEYSFCSKMFTNGQKARMIAAINSSTAGRNNLWTTTNLNAAGVNGGQPLLCAADFEADNFVICEGESVDFVDASYHTPTGWTWTFNGGTPSTSSSQNPTGIVYNTPGTYDVALTVTNASGTQSTTKTGYVTVLPAVGLTSAPIVEGFESATTVPNNDWFVVNSNSGETFQVVSGVSSSGTKSVKLNNFATNGGIDELISTTIDLSNVTALTISFKYAFAYKSSSNSDALKFYVSNDCGQSWSLRKSISGSTLPTANNTTAAFTPNATQWKQVDITNIISTYWVDNFRYKFSYESGGGNNLYIDDINITGPVGVEEVENSFGFSLYPNPSAGNVNFKFTLSSNEEVGFEVLDVLGKVVTSTQLGTLSNGTYSRSIDRGLLSNGVYFVRLRVGNSTVTKKIILN